MPSNLKGARLCFVYPPGRMLTYSSVMARVLLGGAFLVANTLHVFWWVSPFIDVFIPANLLLAVVFRSTPADPRSSWIFISSFAGCSYCHRCVFILSIAVVSFAPCALW